MCFCRTPRVFNFPKASNQLKTIIFEGPSDFQIKELGENSKEPSASQSFMKIDLQENNSESFSFHILLSSTTSQN